jgi:hypothetical protein
MVFLCAFFQCRFICHYFQPFVSAFQAMATTMFEVAAWSRTGVAPDQCPAGAMPP